MKFLKYIFSFLSARYTKVQLLIILVIVVFVFFVSDSNLFARFGYNAKIGELNSQIDYYRNKSVEEKKKLEQLDADKDQIEKFARENYLMKKENEDVYIIE